MARRWRQISVEEARFHPLNGVRGWLLFFVLCQGLGALLWIFTGYFIGYIHFVLECANIVIFFFLFFINSRLFRNVISAMFIANGPISVLILFLYINYLSEVLDLLAVLFRGCFFVQFVLRICNGRSAYG